MPETTARIRAKGLGETGFTEQHAEEAYTHLGGYSMAVVELRHETRINDADGSKRAELVITQLNPVPIRGGDQLEDHLRELARTLDYNRRVSDDSQPRLDGMDEPTPIGDVIAQGKAYTIPDDAEEPDGDDET